MNSITLSGLMLNDAERRIIETRNGKKLKVTFLLSVRRPYSSEYDVWHCEAWDAAAEYILKGIEESRYLKGCFTEVTGYIKKEKKDEREYTSVCIANSFSRKDHKDSEMDYFSGNSMNAAYMDIQEYPDQQYYPKPYNYQYQY